jgi:hypothetical protein
VTVRRAVPRHPPSGSAGTDTYPASATAAELVTRLIVEPPPELPAALVSELADQEKAQVRQRALAGLWAYLGLFAFWPLVPFLGVKSWSALLAMFGVLCGVALFTWRAARTGHYSLLFGLVGNTVLAVAWTRLAGVYLLTPVFICAVLLAMTTTAWMIRNRWAVVAWTLVAFLIPLGLEHIGVLMTSIEVTPGAIISHSTLFEMDSVRGSAALLLGSQADVELPLGWVERARDRYVVGDGARLRLILAREAGAAPLSG